MDRLKGILAAGTLTGLVLITAVAFSLGGPADATNAPPTEPAIVIQTVYVPQEETAVQNSAPSQVVTSGQGDASQEYITQLEAALQVMQTREGQYQTQIETANQTITQLEGQMNQTASNAPLAGQYEEHDEDDDHDDDGDDDEEHDDD